MIEIAKLKILRCGHCGVFCDNHGNIFEATRQLIAADESVGFDDALGECRICMGSNMNDLTVTDVDHN